MQFDKEFDAKLETLLDRKVRVMCVSKLNERDSTVQTGYTVVGYLLDIPKIGETLEMLRLERNGIKVPGHFTTSAVQTFMDSPKEGEWFFTTKNSFYMLEVCDDTE